MAIKTTTADTRLKIFVSYSRRDLVIADQMVAKLEAAGFAVTIDRRDLPYGEEWRSELQDFIRACDTVVWLVSPASVDSKWVNWELGEVGRLNKRLLPVKIADVAEAALPESIGRIHCLPATGIYEEERHLPALVEALNTNRQWLKEATRLADRARQWIGKNRDKGLLLRGSALYDAERWTKEQPKTAPLAPSEVLDLIMSSRRNAAVRRRWWIGGSLTVGTVLLQIGLLSLFFRNDALLNEARYSLQNGKVERAQHQLTDLIDSPINRLMPLSASAQALATQFLDTALVEHLHALPTIGRRREREAFGELVEAGEKLYGALSTSTGSLLFRCDARGRACETTPLGDEWDRIELVRDGADVFIVSHEEDSSQNFKIARVPTTGALTLTSQLLDQAKVPQVRKLEDNFIWRGREYARVLASREEMFQEAPALTTNPKYAEVAGYVKLRLKSDKNHTAEPTEDDDVGHVMLTTPAACSKSRVICITARRNLEADARGTITQFDLWRAALTARDAPTASLPDKAKIRPEVKTPSRAAAKSKPEKKAMPTPVAEYDFIVEKLFEPFPSLNIMAVSPDGATIVISENKRVHVWLTSRVTERDRRQFKTIELAEEPLAILFENNSTDLVVLTTKALVRVKLSPRAFVTASGDDNSVRRAAHENEDSPTGSNKIGRLNNGIEILQTEGGAILAKRGRGLREEVLHQPPPRSKPDVDTWDKDGLVSAYYRLEDKTVLIDPEASASRVSALAGQLAGRLIQIGLNGRLAITLRPNCVLRLHSATTVFVEVSPLGGRAQCELGKGELKFLAPEKENGESVLIVPVPNLKATEDGTLFKAFVVDFRGAKPAVRALLDGSAKQNRAAQWNTDSGMFPDQNGSMVFLETEGGVKVTKLPIADPVVSDLVRRSLAAEKFDIRMLSRDDHMIFLDASECDTPTAKDGREIAGSFALLSRRGDSLVPQFLLTCVPRFPNRAHGHNADTSHFEITGRHLIGAYPFPALLEWKPREATLRLLLLPEPSGDTPGKIEEANVPFSVDANTGLKRADLRTLEYLAFWIGATAIDASDDATRVVIFREAHGSAGHSKAAGVVDLSRMTYRYTPNETSNFFDNISRAELSADAELILTHKQESNRFELFRFTDLLKIPLPDDIEKADFDGNGALTLDMGSGARMRWLVPEGQSQQIKLIRSIVVARN